MKVLDISRWEKQLKGCDKEKMEAVLTDMYKYLVDNGCTELEILLAFKTLADELGIYGVRVGGSSLTP